MGITIKGRHVTVTGELASRIVKAAEASGVTPQEFFEAALEEALKPEHQEELLKEVRRISMKKR